MTRACLLAALMLLVFEGEARAEERFDHRGAIGAWVGGGAGFRTGANAQRVLDGGARYPIDLGISFALPNVQSCVWGSGRLALGGPNLEWSIRAGYRGFFSEDRWKTFYDLGAFFIVTPRFALGPRIGAGVQWEFSPIGGLFASAGVEVGGGNGFHFGADVIVGIQLRTYLLE